MSDPKGLNKKEKSEKLSEKPNPTELFGSMMASARAVEGLSIDQLAAATRINPRFIEAMEQGDLEALPGDVFARGFVRNICKALHLPAEDYLEAYALAADPTPPPPLAEQVQDIAKVQQPKVIAGNDTRKSHGFAANLQKFISSERLPGLAMVAGVLVAVAIPGIVYMMGGGDSGSVSVESGASVESIEPPVAAVDPQQPPQGVEGDQATIAKEAPAVADEEPAAVANEKPSAAVVQAAAAHTIPSEPTAPHSVVTDEAQSVEVIAKEGVRVRFRIDDRGWQTQTLSPDTHRMEFEKALQMLIYDAGAVEVSFNGRSLGSLGGKGRVRRISFAAKTPLDYRKKSL